MDNSERSLALLAEIRDLLRAAEQRQNRIARFTYTFAAVMGVIIAILLVGSGYLFYGLILSAPPPP